MNTMNTKTGECTNCTRQSDALIWCVKCFDCPEHCIAPYCSLECHDVDANVMHREVYRVLGNAQYEAMIEFFGVWTTPKTSPRSPTTRSQRSNMHPPSARTVPDNDDDDADTKILNPSPDWMPRTIAFESETSVESVCSRVEGFVGNALCSSRTLGWTEGTKQL